MKLATKNLRFHGLTEREIVDFSEVETVEQLKEIIIDNYVELCRKCASQSFCKFYDTTQPPCQILVNVVNNYIDMNIKSIDTNNINSISKFIHSIVPQTPSV